VIRNIPYLLLLGFALVQFSGCSSNEDKILPYPIYQHKLANDLNVVTIPFDSPGLAAFYIVVRVGSRNEVEEDNYPVLRSMRWTKNSLDSELNVMKMLAC